MSLHECPGELFITMDSPLAIFFFFFFLERNCSFDLHANCLKRRKDGCVGMKKNILNCRLPGKIRKLQSNFSGSNIFGTMKICSRYG